MLHYCVVNKTNEKKYATAFTIPMKILHGIPVRTYNTHLLEELNLPHPADRKRELAERFFQKVWNNENEDIINEQIMEERIINHRLKSAVDRWLIRDE